jgi:Domain of unknown function (DUF5914)
MTCDVQDTRLMVTDATVPQSDRPEFAVARWMSPPPRPGIRRTARKLGVDDLAYAERRYGLKKALRLPRLRLRR